MRSGVCLPGQQARVDAWAVRPNLRGLSLLEDMSSKDRQALHVASYALQDMRKDPGMPGTIAQCASSSA